MSRHWIAVLSAMFCVIIFAAVSLAQETTENVFVPILMVATNVDSTPTPTGTVDPGTTTTPTPTVTATTTPVGGGGSDTSTPTPTATGSPVPPTPTPTPTATEDTTWRGSCDYLGGDSSPSSRFGVQMYGNTSQESPYFNALVNSDAGWVRVNASWAATEPQDTIPFFFDWTSVDRELAAAGHLRVKVIATIKLAPSWATNGEDRPNGPIDSENLGDFVDFVKALVERYDGDGIDDAPCNPVVNYWELYNEADRIGHGGYRGGWGDDPVAYAEMLRLVYPAIKQVNPNARVLFTGIAYEWFEDEGGPFVRDFTERVFEAGGADYFDIMNFHVYPEFWYVHAPQPPGIIEKTDKIRAIMAQYNVDKPLMITETGAHSDQGGSNEQSEAEQARYVHQIFAQSVASHIDAAIWFMLYDLPSYSYANGLVTAHDPGNGITSREKAAMTAYRLAVEMFERADYVRTLSFSERGRNDLLAYEFARPDGGQTFYVAWLNPIDTTATASLRLEAERVKIRTTYTSYTLYDGSDGVDDGLITVNVGAEPVYVEIVEQQNR